MSGQNMLIQSSSRIIEQRGGEWSAWPRVGIVVLSQEDDNWSALF